MHKNTCIHDHVPGIMRQDGSDWAGEVKNGAKTVVPNRTHDDIQYCHEGTGYPCSILELGPMSHACNVAHPVDLPPICEHLHAQHSCCFCTTASTTVADGVNHICCCKNCRVFPYLGYTSAHCFECHEHLANFARTRMLGRFVISYPHTMGFRCLCAKTCIAEKQDMQYTNSERSSQGP